MEFQEHLNRTYANNVIENVVDINIGVHCCCKIKDGTFHRGRITKLLPDQLCRMRLVDTGVKHTVDWKNCKMLTHEFAEKPAFAEKVALLHTKTGERIKNHSPKEARRFKQQAETQSEFYSFTQYKSVSSNGIFLYYKDPNSSQFICMNRLFMASNHSSDTTDSDQSLHLSPDMRSMTIPQFTKRINVKVNYFHSADAVYLTIEKFFEAKQCLRTDIQNAAAVNEKSVEGIYQAYENPSL